MNTFIIATIIFGTIAFVLSIYMLYQFKEEKESNINKIKNGDK